MSSVLAQTYEHIELIVVDDCSTDRTAEIVSMFASVYPESVQYLKLDRNAGPSIARNAGIASAKGEFITFLDSDDVYYPDKVELQLKAFATRPDAGFCYGFYATTTDFEQAGNRDYVAWDVEAPIYPDCLRASVVKLVTPAVMVRTDVLKQLGGFDTDMRICEDLELWSRMLQIVSAVCVPKILVCIRLRDTGKLAYFENILARDQLYQRVFDRDPKITNRKKHQFYEELIGLYLNQANDVGASGETVHALAQMKMELMNREEDWRAPILEIATTCLSNDQI
jgi:glycosyltransferase involved in cell wall biosynthesis